MVHLVSHATAGGRAAYIGGGTVLAIAGGVATLFLLIALAAWALSRPAPCGRRHALAPFFRVVMWLGILAAAVSLWSGQLAAAFG